MNSIILSAIANSTLQNIKQQVIESIKHHMDMVPKMPLNIELHDGTTATDLIKEGHDVFVIIPELEDADPNMSEEKQDIEISDNVGIEDLICILEILENYKLLQMISYEHL